MSEKKADYSRRDFLKTAGAVGLGSMIAPIENLSNAKELHAANELQQNIVPTRPFGKTGVNVSSLGLGLEIVPPLLLMKHAIKLGVTYWDTAEIYMAGKCEKAIGEYFEKYPDDREKVFLVSKCNTSDPRKTTKSLEASLERMNTSYIDLYFIHMISNTYWIDNDEIKTWVENAKAKGKIRFFGFSTHENMEKCMLNAAEFGWIDGIMATYNYRLMYTDPMKKAVDACVKAGIGLTAMKTQAIPGFGITDVGKETEAVEKLTKQFMDKGYTLEQARLKAVWENPNIASICSHMPNMTILQANVAAALSKTKLSSQDRQLMNQYAQETAPYYCAGCSHNCEPTLNNEVPISDVMRYMMYCRGYEEPERAKSAFRRIPSKTRNIMAGLNYQEAERRCPQKMQIGRLIREAVIELA